MVRRILPGLFLILGMFVQSVVGQPGPLVRVDTELGTFMVSLDSANAPATVANFLRYVDQGYFDDGSFFRTVTMQNQPTDSIRIEVIQGGIAEVHRSLEFAPILLETTEETGLRHIDGSISMARSSPHSATWSFFICIGNQPELDFGGKRNPDGQGFAVFGRVTGGMEVVRGIQRSNATEQSLTPSIRIMQIRRSEGSGQDGW